MHKSPVRLVFGSGDDKWAAAKATMANEWRKKNGAATVQHAEQRDITVCWTHRLIDKWPLGGAVQSGSGEMLIRISTDDLWDAVTDWWKMQMKFDPGLNYLTTWPERRTKYEITDYLFGTRLLLPAYPCGLAVWWFAAHRLILRARLCGSRSIVMTVKIVHLRYVNIYSSCWNRV